MQGMGIASFLVFLPVSKYNKVLNSANREEMGRTMISKEQINSILRLEGKEFVDAAYQAVLGREADLGGSNNYIQAMEKGMSKARILFDLRVSDEGFNKGEQLEGLKISVIDLNQLLRFEDKSFVEVACLAMLGKTGDAAVIDEYLGKLRRGERAKNEIISDLKNTDEGKQTGTQVVGLTESLAVAKLKKLGIHRPSFTKNKEAAQGKAGSGMASGSTVGIAGAADSEEVRLLREQVDRLQAQVDALQEAFFSMQEK